MIRKASRGARKRHVLLPLAVTLARRRVLAALCGLAVVELGVLLALYTGSGVYVAAAALAVVLGYALLIYPPAVAYLAIVWLLFEKGIGGDVGTLSNTISTVGDGLLIVALFQTLLVNLIRFRGRALSAVFTFGPVGPGLVAFVSLGIASMLINDVSLHVGTLGILSTVHSIIILLVIINIGITAVEAERFVYAALAVMGVAAIIGALQIYPHSPAWLIGGERLHASGSLIRVDGPFDHPNSNSDYLAMIIPSGVSLLFFGGLARRWRAALLGALGVMFIALLFTFSREAWIALPVAMVFLGITVERKLLRWFLIVVLPACAALAAAYAPFAHRVTETANGNLRFTLLKLSWPLIRSHLILGVGPGRFGGHVALITHTPLYAQYHLTDFFYGTGNQIDMFWTHLIAESGILGTAAYLLIIVACFLVGRRAYHAATDRRRRALILGLLAVVPVVVVVSTVSATLEAGPGATLFWGLMGMMLVLAGDTVKVPSQDAAIMRAQSGREVNLDRRLANTATRRRFRGILTST